MSIGTFDSVQMTPEQLLAVEGIKEAAYTYEAAINKFVHAGRLKALAMTELEISVMLAVKGVSRG